MIERRALDHLLPAWHRRTEEVTNWEALHGNQTWLLTTTQGEHLVLKAIAERSEKERMESRYRVWLHLAACGLPVAVPFLSENGSCFVSYEDRLYTLSPYLRAVSKVGEKHGLANLPMGRAIGYLHQALATYPGEILSWHMQLTPWVLEQAVPSLLTHLPAGRSARFQEAIIVCEEEMRQAYTHLPEQYIHGDCHTGNLLLEQGEVVGLIDLDHLCWGPKIYDLGYCLADQIKWFTHNPAQTRFWLQQFPVLLQGYEQVNSLSKQEKEALWPVLLAVQVVMGYSLLERQHHDMAAINLDAFFWFYEHKEEITQRLAQTLG